MSGRPFAGKVALVTGGARGIGAAIADRLGRRGASVALTFNTSGDAAAAMAAGIREHGSDALAFRADSGSPDQVAAAVQQVAGTFGRIDFLVNNAGLGSMGRIEQVDLDQFDRMVAVNLRGMFVAVRETLPHMPRGGRIINIGSISSDYLTVTGNAVYAMVKAGIRGLTKGLVREFAERAITINNIEPGRVDTEILRHGLKERFDEERSATPLGRFGTPDEVAGLVEYVCSEAAGYITGADLRIDGGVSIG